MPQLGDPNFHRAVVLMVEHSEGGSMGLVVNHPGTSRLDELAAAQKLSIPPERRDNLIYLGGPVEPQRGFVLHDSDSVEERVEVMPGLFLSVTFDALNEVLQKSGARMRFCV